MQMHCLGDCMAHVILMLLVVLAYKLNVYMTFKEKIGTFEKSLIILKVIFFLQITVVLNGYSYQKMCSFRTKTKYYIIWTKIAMPC